MERIITKSFARLMGRGIHRGFITHEELNKSLGKRNLSNQNLEQAFVHILNEKITLVEKKSDFKVLRKKDSSSKEEGKTLEKSDDPIRMYLRERVYLNLLEKSLITVKSILLFIFIPFMKYEYQKIRDNLPNENL